MSTPAAAVSRIHALIGLAGSRWNIFTIWNGSLMALSWVVVRFCTVEMLNLLTSLVFNTLRSAVSIEGICPHRLLTWSAVITENWSVVRAATASLLSASNWPTVKFLT